MTLMRVTTGDVRELLRCTSVVKEQDDENMLDRTNEVPAASCRVCCC